MTRRILIVLDPGAQGAGLPGVRGFVDLANAYAIGEGSPAPFEIELVTRPGAPSCRRVSRPAAPGTPGSDLAS